MPKVALPEVPLVMEAAKCGIMPLWPLKIMLPQPQFGPPGASAMAMVEVPSNSAPISTFFIFHVLLGSLCVLAGTHEGTAPSLRNTLILIQTIRQVKRGFCATIPNGRHHGAAGGIE